MPRKYKRGPLHTANRRKGHTRYDAAETAIVPTASLAGLEDV